MKLQHLLLLIFLQLALLFSSCATKPKGVFENNPQIIVPDYGNDKYWAALPWVEDNADKTPEGLTDLQSTAKADVFFLHPTMYYGAKSYNKWNAPIELKKLNDEVDNTSILFQATVFNAAGRVFAPRYRQAHINVYFTNDTSSARKALDLAYIDVKNAFEYYLKHHNNGRPIIIASHSQGTTHAKKLIKDYFDNKPLKEQLVVAYLLGMKVELENYETIKACETAKETGCLVSWRTFKKGTNPDFLKSEKQIIVTNPLSWTTDNNWVNKDQNLGSVFSKFEGEPKSKLVGAQVYKSILWCDKPKFPGSFFMRSNNYHRGDINLFYMNIRENSVKRVQAFITK